MVDACKCRVVEREESGVKSGVGRKCECQDRRSLGELLGSAYGRHTRHQMQPLSSVESLAKACGNLSDLHGGLDKDETVV